MGTLMLDRLYANIPHGGFCTRIDVDDFKGELFYLSVGAWCVVAIVLVAIFGAKLYFSKEPLGIGGYILFAGKPVMNWPQV